MVISMTRSLCEKALCKKRRIGRGRGDDASNAGRFSHRDRRLRLDEYQCNVADSAPMRIFNFGKMV
jgi:hypothetical protein